MFSIAKLFTAALAVTSVAVAAVTPQQAVDGLRLLTQKAQELQAPAQSISLVTAPLIVIGQGPFPDGSLHSWPDGELVTLDKLAAWLKEDILLRRVKVPTRRRPRSRQPQHQRQLQEEQEQADAAALAEVKTLAETLEVPLAEVAELLADDRQGYVAPVGLIEATELPTAAALAEGSLLTKSTVDAYIAAVLELWRLQVAHGNGNTENPRGTAVRGFLEQRGRQRSKHDRASFKDRGSDGIQAGYSTDEWRRIQDLLLGGAAYALQNLRTRVDLLLGHYYLLRGENRRKMELADLSLLDYPQLEGPTLCGCLVSLLQDGKLNKTARKEFMGALRHKDPLFCTQGALAQLFFWRWHVAGEAPPSFRQRKDWYRIKVLVGRDCEQELSYPTQLQETWRIFGAAGLVALPCADLAGRPLELERALSGLPNAPAAPVYAHRRRLLSVRGGLLPCARGPRAATRPTKAALALDRGDEFALAVRSDVGAGAEPPSLLLQRALPELSGVLESSREALLQNSRQLVSRLEGRLQGIQGSLDALLQGRVPITFTGYFGAGPTGPVEPPPTTMTPTPAPVPIGISVPIASSAGVGAAPGLPVVTALARAFTVTDVWREWTEGLAGRPAIRELEETWGSRWRPGNAVRVQFCRRKVIWDEVLARAAHGKSEVEAVAELELLRAGRSLNQLVDELKQRRQGQLLDRGRQLLLIIAGIADQTKTAHALNFGEITPAGDECVFNAYREFVHVEQTLLNILIGKAGLVKQVPLVGQPIAAILRQLEDATDTLSLQLIETVDTRSTDLTRESKSLGESFSSAIEKYDGLSL
ncbi:hypothetical protein V500_00289 [Pseudogymnoascus sp. VKM F-4518 (FW-2643)]|nr:hypothetical protein V500_00289 [Pseudogymnoascus sp. VKM F-4518 (FW-2643)]